jgi:hypothetical protein
MHCIQLQKGTAVEILAFADSAGQAEALVAQCAAARVEAANGAERAAAAFTPPEGEGLYLVKGADLLSVELRRKRVSKSADGWIFAGTVEIVDETEGHVVAVEFDVDALHPDTSAVVPVQSLGALRPPQPAPRTIQIVKERRIKPWLTELKTHPKFCFASL